MLLQVLLRRETLRTVWALPEIGRTPITLARFAAPPVSLAARVPPMPKPCLRMLRVHTQCSMFLYQVIDKPLRRITHCGKKFHCKLLKPHKFDNGIIVHQLQIVLAERRVRHVVYVSKKCGDVTLADQEVHINMVQQTPVDSASPGTKSYPASLRLLLRVT